MSVPADLVTGSLTGAIVFDRDHDDRIPSLAVVTHECIRSADKCYVDALDKTVAEVNPDYHAKGDVVEVQFMPSFMAWSNTTYSYPVERLELVDPVSEWVERFYPDGLDAIALSKVKPFVKRVRATYGTYDDLEHLPQ